MINKFLICMVISTNIFFCTGSTTDQLLNSEFISKELTPVDAITPSNKETVSSKTPEFIWIKRGGAIRYLLEIGTKSDFSNIVLSKKISGTSYTLTNNDLTTITQLDDASYYWRVTAEYNDRKISSSAFVFHVLSGTTATGIIVYVNGSSTASEQVGNKTFPIKSIQGGVSYADTRRNSDTSVAVDVYVAQGTYVEEVQMRPGISIRGGFEATNWTRSILANRTIIVAPDYQAVKVPSTVTSSFRSTTIIDGFNLTKGTTQAAGQIIQIAGGASPTISNNNIYCGTGNTGSDTKGIDIDGTSAALIFNNSIAAGNSTINNYGIVMANSASPIILNNTISGGGAGLTRGIGIANGSSPTIRNNIIFNGNTTGYCIDEFNATANVPVAVENNNLFDCSTGFYRDDAGVPITSMTVGTFVTSAGTNNLQAFGNINITNTANQLFLDFDGIDNLLPTGDDNDLHLTSNGVICNVRFGGLDLSSLLGKDRDGVSRTNNLASLPCALSVPSTTKGQGWSIGAFEKD